MKDLKYYYNKALKGHFALGALNFSNMETLQAITNACKKLKSPMIIAVSESALKYMGDDMTMALATAVKKDCKGLFLHLDHGKSFDVCKKAINLGFDSVMIDGSALTFEENIALTKKVCTFAHKKGVLVEGELGQLKGIEDYVSAQEHHFTDPQKAKIFVEKTGVDSLAVAIGTSHGAYKYSGKQTLRFDILSEIEEVLPFCPLVLHGASCVDKKIVDIVNKYGGKIENAQGVSEELSKISTKAQLLERVNLTKFMILSLFVQKRLMLSLLTIL